MKIIASLVIAGALLLGPASRLQAQILNGSFTDTSSGSTSGFADWTLVGGGTDQTTGPVVLTNLSALPSGVIPPTPPSGTTTQAFLQSTDEDFDMAMSASGATLNSKLHVLLGLSTTDTNLLDATFGQTFPATNGQAIYQTFSVNAPATLSFAYSTQSDDYYPYDSAGYVLDGIYTSLITQPPYTDPFVPNETPTTYATKTLTLGLTTGTHTLAFVAFNTGGHAASTSLFVTDVSADVVPEPSQWELLLMGLFGLFLVRKLRLGMSGNLAKAKTGQKQVR